MSDQRQEELRRRLFELGFDDVRFAATAEPLKAEPLSGWLAAGMHGEMGWMERTAEKRLDPTLVLEGVKSVILLGVSYADEPRSEKSVKTSVDPVWARYALHEDYHDTMKPALIRAGRLLEELYGAVEADYRYYVDTGPVLERSWSARAGLGFIGKNGMLISKQHGNWLFLAAILTRVEFTPDPPIRKKLLPDDSSKNEEVGLLCGKCTRCLDACPTDAFPRPGVVDSRRCISYQTIENKGIIPRELRVAIGSRIYGCDVCLEVCPWNRFAQKGRAMLLVAKHHLKDVPLAELLELTPARFAELFRGTAMKRVKLRGLLRNACIVAGNSGDTRLLPALVKLAEHEVPLVRAHAVWAIHRLAGPANAASLLAAIRPKETDASVIVEYTMADREATDDKAATLAVAAEESLGRDDVIGP